MSTNGVRPFLVARCDGCGSDQVEAIDEHGYAQCRVCLAEASGWRAGQQDDAEKMVAAVIDQAKRHLTAEQLHRIVDRCLGRPAPTAPR